MKLSKLLKYDKFKNAQIKIGEEIYFVDHFVFQLRNQQLLNVTTMEGIDREVIELYIEYIYKDKVYLKKTSNMQLINFYFLAKSFNETRLMNLILYHMGKLKFVKMIDLFNELLDYKDHYQNLIPDIATELFFAIKLRHLARERQQEVAEIYRYANRLEIKNEDLRVNESNYAFCLDQIYEHQLFDVALHVNDINGKAKIFQIHRAILGCNSRFFEGLFFYQENDENVAHNSNLTMPGFEFLIYFIYHSEMIKVDKLDLLVLLLNLDFYQLMEAYHVYRYLEGKLLKMSKGEWKTLIHNLPKNMLTEFLAKETVKVIPESLSTKLYKYHK